MKRALIFLSTLAFSSLGFAQGDTKPTATPIPESHVAEILLTINDGEVELGQLARRNAQNKEVKDFAAMMVDTHKKNMKETKRVAKKAKIDAEKNDTSRGLKEEAEAKHRELKAAEKNAFDTAYMQSQVAMHEKALSTLDGTLIPSARNEELKEHLRKTRQSVQEHLEHAKTVQAKLQ